MILRSKASSSPRLFVSRLCKSELVLLLFPFGLIVLNQMMEDRPISATTNSIYNALYAPIAINLRQLCALASKHILLML